ncbi:MAG: biotin-dependent carboxyltransferase family protein [Acidobacteriota bacterium]|nr:biotin-dependent carboxyltransferase family protein [Acidobacteriota bacterium]
MRIIKPGLLTTVQDLGRWGHQASGVPVAGPMDPYAHRLANLLVGNPENAATLELTLIGPELVFEQAATFALTGADLGPRLDGRRLPTNTVCQAEAGAVLAFGGPRRGARSYLAIAGGLQVPAVFGSRATHLISAMGGLSGRALRAGDRLQSGPVTGRVPRQGWRLPPIVPLPEGGAVLRVRPGPQAEYFTDEALRTLESARFTISTRSDRMGYRLDGPPLTHARGADIISDATPLGVLQVPASGQPILLMADRQTTGGYPKIATVITADLALAGQLAPGDWIGFRVCTLREALRALIEQERPFVQS